jgi:hypothetical protein
MSPKRILGLAIAAPAGTSSAPLAATGLAGRVRGTIASATAVLVAADTHASKPASIAMTGSTIYLDVAKSTLNEVEAGSFIGTAIRDASGTQVAQYDDLTRHNAMMRQVATAPSPTECAAVAAYLAALPRPYWRSDRPWLYMFAGTPPDRRRLASALPLAPQASAPLALIAIADHSDR